MGISPSAAWQSRWDGPNFALRRQPESGELSEPGTRIRQVLADVFADIFAELDEMR
jgi:hypothetical protein